MLQRLRGTWVRKWTEWIANPSDGSESKVLADKDALHNIRTQGNQYLANGNLHAAERCFREALSLDENDTNTLTCLGYTLKEKGDFSGAHEHLGRVIELLGNAPEAHEACYLLGQVSEAIGKAESARLHYLKVLHLKPDFTLACNDLRRLFVQMERSQEIPILLRQCAQACPHVLDYGYWYGLWLLENAQYGEAIVEFERLIVIKPDFATAYNNLGICLHEVGRDDEAIQGFTAAIQFNPDLSQAYSNRGAILLWRNQFDAAIADFEASIRLSPEAATPYLNLGEVMRETRRLDVAITLYEKAIELEPSSPTGYWNKSLALLLGGNFIEGFSLYEYRFHDSRKDNKRDFEQPQWDGSEVLAGKSILIHCEQGLGDTIQFCRYVPMVAAMGATVIFEAPRPLWSLLQGLPGRAELVDRGTSLPLSDYHCPLLSLPHAFNTDENSIPAQRAYLTASDAQRVKWSQRLGKKKLPRVGVVWSGSTTHKNDHNRSLALATVMASLPVGFQYISLQQEIRPIDTEALGASSRLEHFGAELTDFSDTAALCELMDLVISVDTSVAHLAAAIGKPTWILLPYSVDWRWMLNRSDSPWYPSVTLYRQQTAGEWSDVLLRVTADLQSYFDEPRDV